MTFDSPFTSHRTDDQSGLVRIEDYTAPFSIGRYPVTMAEYGNFLDDTGWRRPRHWPTTISSVHQRMPVSWVNHFDANAYCYWLAKKDRVFGSLAYTKYFLPTTDMLRAAARSTAAVARLRERWQELSARSSAASTPTEREREIRAAAQEAPTSKFPWGDQPDPKRCNCSEFRPHRPGPTPVDQFAQAGSSAYGVSDLSGNLWEMTCTFAGSGEKGQPAKVDFLNFFDPRGPDFLHFRDSWQTTLAYVVDYLEKTEFAWNLKFDILGGSYGTPAKDCGTDTPAAWTSAANFGPYAGFRVACVGP
jgi:formylglycine-generating enzyme required for sulfatase activity